MTKTLSALFLSAAVVVGLHIAFSSTVFAAGNVSVSPKEIHASPGETVSQEIRITTNNDTVNAVEIALTYPADKLSLVSISATGSAFPIGITSNGGNGSMQISRGVVGEGVNGTDKLVATVTFKVQTSALSEAFVKVSQGTILVRSSDQQNIFGGSTSGTILIDKTPITPTPQTSGSLILSDVRASGISYNKATIRWTTNKPSSSFVEYGLTKAYGFSATDKELTTDHALSLPEDTLVPGTVYLFRVKSIDKDGRTATSESTSFTTIGAGVAINVVNEQGKAVPGAKVIASTPQGIQVQITKEDGTVNFENMPPTNVDITTEVAGKKQTSIIAIKEPTQDPSLKNQNYTVRVAGMQTSKIPSEVIVVGSIIFIACLVTGIVFFKKRISRTNQATK